MAVIGTAVTGCTRPTPDQRESSSESKSNRVPSLSDDAAINDLVTAAFQSDDRLRTLKIFVSTKQGVVTLEGVANSRIQRLLMLQKTIGIYGVERVNDRLKVDEL